MNIINKLILWAAQDPRKEESKMILKLTEEIERYKIVAYARINHKGDLFDLRLQNNPYVNQDFVVPLYAKID